MFDRLCKNCRHFDEAYCKKHKKPVRPFAKACSAFRLSKAYLDMLDEEESEMEDIDGFDLGR